MPNPCGFSEMTYAFAFIQEVLDQWGIVGLPLLPSTVAEGQDGGGYDVELEFDVGGLVFVQFKVPVTLDHHRSAHNGYLGQPYYRYKLPKRRALQAKSQHEMLLELEADDDCIVIYAAPRFASVSDLTEAKRDQQIYPRSFCPYPSEIGSSLNPTSAHTVSYRASDDRRVVQSTPVQGESVVGPGQLIDFGFEGVQTVDRSLSRADFNRIAESIEQQGPTDPETGEPIPSAIDELDGFARLQHAARTFLSVEVLPVPASPLPRTVAAFR
jgi:hypothetical protein